MKKIRGLLAATAALTAFVAISSLPTPASAQIYTYQTPTGETLITTEKRNQAGYKLIGAVENDGSRPSSSSRASIRSSAQAPTMGSSTRSFAERERMYDDIIREASQTYDVPFGFVKAVIRVESAFQKDAVSHAGAMGLMQLMPRTAASLNVTDAFNPRQNIFGGTKFLRILIDRYDGDINLILAAYNAGDVAVRRYDGIPYAKTRQYVASVYHWYQVYASQESE
jgi:soluble lytic murein transglycosylase-like protein